MMNIKKMFLALCCIYSSTLFSQTDMGVLYYDEEKTQDGYIFFSSIFDEESYLIDNCGRLINKWKGNDGAGLSAEFLPTGQVLRTEETSGHCCYQTSAGGRVELRNWNNDLEWYYEMSDFEKVQHHDFVYMPNGNILLLGWEVIDVEEQLDLGKQMPYGSGLWGEFIVEITPDSVSGGTIVWEWHLKDHFVQDIDSTLANYGVISEEVGKLDVNYAGPSFFSSNDWFHCNAIAYNPERDEVILNSRGINEFWIIDHSTTTEEAQGDSGGAKGKGGNFIFRWGNPEASKNGDQTALKMYGAHGTRWVSKGLPNEGKIIFFNNGDVRPGGDYSTAEMLEPALDSVGNYMLEPNGQYRINEHRVLYGELPYSLYSAYLSNVQQLENGNFLINEGGSGRFIEIDDSGEVVWEYRVPLRRHVPIGQGITNRFYVFRAYKYSPDFPGFDGLDLTPGDVIELTSLDVCEMVSSDESVLTDEYMIFPNPAEDKLNYTLPENWNSEININVFDLSGRKKYTSTQNSRTGQIDIQNLSTGIYFVEFHSDEKKQIERFMVK